MAEYRHGQETLIHRIDAELAAGLPVTAVPDDLAVDGIDEVLNRMLAFGSVAWPGEFAEMEGEHLAGDGEDTITAAADQAAWTVRPSPRYAEVEDGGSEDPRVVIAGAPAAVLRWLWGRAGDDAVRLTGDPAWAGYLRGCSPRSPSKVPRAYLTWRPEARRRADGSCRVVAGARSRNSAYVSGARSDSATP